MNKMENQQEFSGTILDQSSVKVDGVNVTQHIRDNYNTFRNSFRKKQIRNK